jgi:DNA-binding NtrC family response regulator
VVSSHSQPDEIREAQRLGAEDYVVKTEVHQRVPIILKELRRKLQLREDLLDSRARGVPDPTLGLVGTSVAMQNLRALIHRVATANSQEPVPILILGPTGSGKELVAQAIHRLGPHPSDPFFDLNCGAIAETLIDDQLFGHVRGAFTDATRDQDGYFALARRGTLFLDEVAELSPALQAKLLRVLETRRFRPVGPTAREQSFQGRIVAATHVDLKERIRQGRFREDLFHRFNVLFIRVPPLSEHLEDIPALVQHFASKHRKPLHFTQQAIELLCRRSWPGNVRELRNAVDRLAILADSERIDAETIERYLPLDLEGTSGEGLSRILKQVAQKLLALPIKDKIDTITRALVLEAVEQAEGNNTKAGKLLGCHRRTVERLLRKCAHPEQGEPEDEDKDEPEE